MKPLGRWFEKILGTRLCYRMFLLYILGGALPMILMGLYLVTGSNRILVERAKEAEAREMELTARDMNELLSTVNDASHTFYFDAGLEHIASCQYTAYADLVEDYRAYKTFDQLGERYNRLISHAAIYLKNDTISGNAHFQKADEAVQSAAWYQQVLKRGGGGVWQYLPFHLDGEMHLALTRLIKTKRSGDVGVLVLYMRRERLQELTGGRDADIRLILNGQEQILGGDGEVDFEELRELLGDMGGSVGNTAVSPIRQEQIRLSAGEYILTCVNLDPAETDDVLWLVSLKSYHDILSTASRQNRGSVIIFLCSAALSVSMILVFSWSFGSRVSRFRRQMQKAAQGRFDLEPSLGGSDEISELYDYLGTMIRDIERLLSEVYQERLHGERLMRQQKEAEFKMLASQINPHFLYNTLETIRMKARVNGQPEIEQLVKMLSKLLRRNLQAGSADVSLSSELDLVEYYLKIQQYRFGERIQYTIKLESDLGQVPILPLALQPIVENSIIHGLEAKEGTGHIVISAARREGLGLDEQTLPPASEVHMPAPPKPSTGCIEITITDDGLGMTPEALTEVRRKLNSRNLTGSHIGVSNVHQRLRLRYGDAYGLSIDGTEGEGTRVVLRIPG